MERFQKYILLAVILFLPAFAPLHAQHVSFGTYAEDDLFVQVMTPDELDFGSRVSGEGVVSILLSGQEAVPVKIEGAAYLDVTVTLEMVDGEYLLLQGDPNNFDDPNKRMLVDIKMAYYNRGQKNIDVFSAKEQSIEVMGHTATFQISRRPGEPPRPPGPPPTPPHAGYVPPPGHAYIFIFGNLTVGNVNAGPYSARINVHVEYATYQ